MEAGRCSGDYDPLLAKLIAWGADRNEAAARLRRALDEFDVRGIRTNISLFRQILADPEFLSGDIYTRWLDERLPSLLAKTPEESSAKAVSLQDVAVIAAVLWQMNHMAAAASARRLRHASTGLALETRRAPRTTRARPGAMSATKVTR